MKRRSDLVEKRGAVPDRAEQPHSAALHVVVIGAAGHVALAVAVRIVVVPATCTRAGPH